jgi:hypothetical protein
MGDMMSNVDFTLIEKQPEKTVIEHLEALLENARKGELQELVYVCSYKGNFVNHGWTKLNNRMRLIGELEQVKWHLLSQDR